MDYHEFMVILDNEITSTYYYFESNFERSRKGRSMEKKARERVRILKKNKVNERKVRDERREREKDEKRKKNQSLRREWR